MLEKAGLNRARGELAIDWTCAHAVGIVVRQMSVCETNATKLPMRRLGGKKEMKVFGVQLHTPGLVDLPMAITTIFFAVVCSGLAMRFLGWDIAQVSGILFGSTAAATATACGVDVRSHGLRGLLVVLVIMVALVATTVGLHRLFN
ncbi:hypothetical protein [Pseudomonas syringae]|nr:hypothetical protein [Pseudomonas syringae]APQ06972.1 hypothetical protein PsaNZ47_29975 [Pseudomonas syringae pv. actinidiae]OKS54991.1 hypothetical protein PsaNZ62_13670 [Pseudomonas syringae pv. actinidiae]OKS74154.1 hypothetical protein PsaNZ64_13945 [Pseudomonas syringae pv. actinidiae]